MIWIDTDMDMERYGWDGMGWDRIGYGWRVYY
jgi:hypothetical protein